MPLPFNRLQCHTKRGGDLCFVDSSVIVASVGLSNGSDASSLCLWDALLPPASALVASCAAHKEGGRCVVHCAADQSLISGGDKGEIAIYDLRQRRLRARWRGHSAAIQALALTHEKLCFSADANGSLELWDILGVASSFDDEDWDKEPLGSWSEPASSIFAPLVGKAGINALEPASWPAEGLLSGGGGGLKLWPIVPLK